MHKQFILTLFLLLAGCVSSSSSGPWIHWTCDGETELLWRHVPGQDDQVQLRLDGAERIYLLQRQPSGSGTLYSDGELVFHTKGEQGLIYWAQTDDLIGSHCRDRSH